MKENQREDECLLWLLVDRLADAADPEVYVQRAPQIARKLSLTFQQLDVEVRALVLLHLDFQLCPAL